ncbi:uncharacterized protein LOC127095195 [Lathyrus oleraceus]|uniref:uncharacterized protein LOC127095195 n=1 Tax=Pisum sativum TaxID=3888 RepID=UPI0021D31952|nr:uncharacterized protein LOC127095195 [Pisum sativum]
MSRLQLITTRFENLMMKDDENIHDFHMSILEIAKSSSSLGERMSEEKLVKKTLRSLSKFFDMKATTIEEARGISFMRVDELIGSLQTFELGISEKTEKKTKSITFVSNTENEQNQCDLDIDEGMTNALVLLGRQFNKRRSRTKERSNQGKGIQCHGCEGFRHIRDEYPTYLKKQKKGLSFSWSDEDNSESEPEEEADKHVTALTRRWESEDELSYEELAASYRELCIRSEEVESLGGKRYANVIVDDFSRFTWVNFIKEKSDVFEVFKDLCKRIQREKEREIIRIRSDHGKEFENSIFVDFCSSEGIGNEFSSPITPHQNRVVERKNRTLQ